MAGKLIYVSYASGRFEANLQVNARYARWLGGAERCILLTRRDLEASRIYAPHRDVFDAPRGAGYWAWKPWAILRAMDAAGPEDVIYYHDCGFGLRYKTFLRLRRLVALAREHGFVAGVACPQYGPNRIWNRRQCRELMGVGGRADIAAAPSIQATWSLWSNTPAARAFVERWLAYCLQFDAIRDASPAECAQEDEGFVEHRHDQAILTNLTLREGGFFVEPMEQTLDFAKSAAFLELDLRAREGGFYRLVYRLLLGLVTRRRAGR
ncbi:MAG TPA: hypothetical protein VN222_06215 [Novosphingobium sp.]|nr:hypothetical protein [Novosphingobium sp.]